VKSIAGNPPQACPHKRDEQGNEGNEEVAVVLGHRDGRSEDFALRPVRPNSKVDLQVCWGS
jgi:hypothetical protein